MNHYLISILALFGTTPLTANATLLRGLEGGGRRTQQSGFRDFVPLSCNSRLSSASCTPWSTYVGTSSRHNEMVTIECGDCVIMDHASDTLSLLDGLDVRGKLVFPDNYKLNVEATMILVQGELEMMASKPVDGSPNVMITMIGEDDLSFEPHDVNSGACLGEPCKVGKKGIVVAGGKVTTAGLPPNTPTWLHLYDVKGDRTIVVQNSVTNKWSVGAEILITSHTRVWNEHQVRKITAVRGSTEPGFLELDLDEPIVRPTTLKDSKDFAVEIALLSRNILFLGGADSNANHGGHFMIMHTPKIVQTIEGIEFRNFGQQGYLGRYPIHFHLMDDASGSVISKNTIRDSNQRCVVVHGTNFLEIKENIAYDTAGHCFLTEDGIETGNLFSRNLGAQTKIPDKIIPDEGLNGEETDDEPATFWITSTSNSYEGNVAAGSENSGFWFEPLLRGERADWFPDLEPQKVPLTLFENNVAHSTVGKTGAIRMYTPGFFPTRTAYFTGLKVYRNNASGIFIHRCHNIVVRDSLFADNNIGVDIDRAEGVEVRDTVIIGESDSYRELMQRQNVEAVCRRGMLTGVDLHTWKKEKAYAGALMTNVDFSGFSGTACPDPASFRFDTHTLKQGIFEFYTQVVGTTLRDGPGSIDFCIVDDNDEFDMVFIVDSDGSLNPSPVATRGPSTLISNSPQLTEFVKNPSKCTEVPEGCYRYCADTCFRSVRYEVENGSGYTLKVCDPYDHSSCVVFPGGRRGNNGPHTLLAHLPVGQKYQAIFVDSRGREVSGATVVEEYEESYCSISEDFEVTLYDSLPPESIRPPTSAPTWSPTANPTRAPTRAPTSTPTTTPTLHPTGTPTMRPTDAPTTSNPTKSPVSSATYQPTSSASASGTGTAASASEPPSPGSTSSPITPTTTSRPTSSPSDPSQTGSTDPESTTPASVATSDSSSSNTSMVAAMASIGAVALLLATAAYVFRGKLPRAKTAEKTMTSVHNDTSGLTKQASSDLTVEA